MLALAQEPSHLTYATPETASELDGEVARVSEYAAFSDSELWEVIERLGEAVGSARWSIGWATTEILARAEISGRLERSAFLDQLASKCKLLSRSDFRACFYVARQWSPAEVMTYADKPWTWFLNITARTAYAGAPTSEERQAEVRRVAENCAELNTIETREYLDQQRPQPEGTRFDHLELEPHPPAEAPPVPGEARIRFLKALGRILRDDPPGTIPLILEAVEKALDGFSLQETTQCA